MFSRVLTAGLVNNDRSTISATSPVCGYFGYAGVNVRKGGTGYQNGGAVPESEAGPTKIRAQAILLMRSEPHRNTRLFQ